jgi:hypothetical protein
LTIDQRVPFVDSGIAFSLVDFLSSPNPAIARMVCELIAALTPDCDYLIDSFFTFDFHSQLIDLIHKSTDEPLQISAAQAIFRLYGDHDRILSTILKDSLPRLVSLLNVNSTAVLSFALKALTEVTNQRCSLAYVLFDAGVSDRSVGFLDEDNLKSSVIPLLGNLCLSGRDHIAHLIDLGLLEKLFGLTETVYSADAFWVLSILIETAPDLYFETETSEESLGRVISLAVQRANSDSLQLVKEATFFLASLIIFVSKERLPMFMRIDVFNVLIRVLVVSQDVVAKARFLDVFMRFCIHVQHSSESFALFRSLITECGLLQTVDELKQGDQSMLKLKALEIEAEIEAWARVHEAAP